MYLKGVYHNIVSIKGQTTTKLMTDNKEFKTDFFVVNTKLTIPG